MTGNVGIGYTDTSGNKLAVNGAIYSSSSITAGTQLCIGASCQSSWPGSQWAASGNNIYNTNSGNVGIGTTGPGDLLHIYKSSGSGGGIKLTNTATAAESTADILFSVGAHGDRAVIKGIEEQNYNSLGALSFWTVNPTSGMAERVRIDSNGNVGIGDITPDGLLDIEGSFDYNNGLKVQSSGTGGSGIMLKNTSMGGKEFYIFSTGSANGEGAGKLAFLDAAVGTRMLIDGNGNVGIGTTSPSVKLDVNGSARISGNLDMNGNNISGVNKLTVTTIDPEYTFDGKKYATYVASFAGGVKEETTGKIKLTTYNKQQTDYERSEE